QYAADQRLRAADHVRGRGVAAQRHHLRGDVLLQQPTRRPGPGIVLPLGDRLCGEGPYRGRVPPCGERPPQGADELALGDSPPMKTSLVVEDETIISFGYRVRLRRMGFEVIGTARSSEEAEAFLRTDRPDVISVDNSLKGEK